MFDTPSKFHDDSQHADSVAIVTRKALEGTPASEMSSELWTMDKPCVTTVINHHLKQCKTGGKLVWAELPLHSKPFLAQLPSGYNTGLIRQFVPRFNFSTVEYEKFRPTIFQPIAKGDPRRFLSSKPTEQCMKIMTMGISGHYTPACPLILGDRLGIPLESARAFRRSSISTVQ